MVEKNNRNNFTILLSNSLETLNDSQRIKEKKSRVEKFWGVAGSSKNLSLPLQPRRSKQSSYIDN